MRLVYLPLISEQAAICFAYKRRSIRVLETTTSSNADRVSLETTDGGAFVISVGRSDHNKRPITSIALEGW
jgi:hypothetical protein